MRLEWLGQFAPPVCRPGQMLDPTFRFCMDIPPGFPGYQPPPVATFDIPEVTVTPTSPSEGRRNATLLWAAGIVTAGIIAAVVLR